MLKAQQIGTQVPSYLAFVDNLGLITSLDIPRLIYSPVHQFVAEAACGTGRAGGHSKRAHSTGLSGSMEARIVVTPGKG